MSVSKKVSRQFFLDALQCHVFSRPLSTSVKRDDIDQVALVAYLQNHRLEYRLLSLIKPYFSESDLVIQSLSPSVTSYPFRFLKHQKQLQVVVSRFQEKGLQFCILKGFPLNFLIYDTRPLRFSKDIDIWVHPHSRQEAHDILVSLGYRYTPQLTFWISRICKDFTYRTSESEIELHQFPVLNPEIGCRWLDTVRLIDIHHVTYPILGIEEQWVYLCFHAAKHHWNRLHWLVDLALLFQKTEINWDKVVAIGIENHAIRPLNETAILLKEFFNIHLPCTLPLSVTDRISASARLGLLRLFFYRVSNKKKLYRSLFFMVSWTLYTGLRDKRDYILVLVSKLIQGK